MTAGLFMYPVLMAADILLFKANAVPVGRDQVQHVEMARDMAQRFNNRYGGHLVLPQAEIDPAVATLPGLDGRKMSKSYDNTIPLLAPAAALRKLIFSVVTDSRGAKEPKEAEGSSLFQLSRLCRPGETAAMGRRSAKASPGRGEPTCSIFASMSHRGGSGRDWCRPSYRGGLWRAPPTPGHPPPFLAELRGTVVPELTRCAGGAAAVMRPPASSTSICLPERS